MYSGICEAIHRELDKMEERYAGGAQMTGKDLEDIDLMTHALKNIATYEAMTEYEEPPRMSRNYGRRY